MTMPFYDPVQRIGQLEQENTQLRARLATYKRLTEAWEIYFQALDEKEKHNGKKAWLWVGFFGTAENMARAALREVEQV